MIRVSAAIGILMALSPKRENDSARGSFLRKELPTGLRLAGGNGPQGLSSSRLKAEGSRLKASTVCTSASHTTPQATEGVHLPRSGSPAQGSRLHNRGEAAEGLDLDLDLDLDL